MGALDKLLIGIAIVGSIITSYCIGVKTSLNQSKQIIILEAKLEQSDKSTLYYRTQYLKANGQLIELKNRVISNEVIIN